MSKLKKQYDGNSLLGLWNNLKIKNKLLLSITLLMILITVSILIAVNNVITENMLKNKQKMVYHTATSVENLLEERQKTLEKYVSFLSQNQGLLDAVNTCIFTLEYENLGKQTQKLQREINVERIIVCRAIEGNKYEICACSTGEKNPGELIVAHRLFNEAEGKEIASELLIEDGMFNLKVCTTLKNKGSIVAFLIIDDFLGQDLVEQIEASTGAEMCLLMNKGNNTGIVITSAHKDLIGREISGDAFTEMMSTLNTTYQSNFVDEGELHMAAFKPILDKNNKAIGSMMILVHMDDVLNMKTNTMKAMSSIGLFAIAIGIIAIIMLVKSIINPMRQLLFTAQAIGKGDLTQKVKTSGTDEIGQISLAFSQMQDNLLNLVKQIKGSVELLESSSVELSTSSRQQADGSVLQSSSLTETATTVEELAATSKQIAENARAVADLARQSLTGMENIRNNTDQEANRILTLGEKSQTIGEVVAMIDDIAKQTNILALNASIEAERAGDAGKGFAVVAIEIRELATNVAKSTKQIREIIKEIQDATNASVMATENVGKSVAEGIELSKQAAESANQISMATQQQGSASEQVVSAIRQMSDIVGQTTAGANQIADTAHQLVELTTEQKKLIEQFTIN